MWGAVDYARQLGFQPAPDFGPAAGHLGSWDETSAITFGRDGVPFYVQGPYDNPNTVLGTLTRAVGKDDFHFAAVAGATADHKKVARRSRRTPPRA